MPHGLLLGPIGNRLSLTPPGRRNRTPPLSTRSQGEAFGFEPFIAPLRALRMRESSSSESPVRHGTTLMCAESLSVYPPMIAVAFIQPDFDIWRAQVFSHQLHGLLSPPVALSGRHVQLERFQVIEDGVTEAVNVTVWDGVTLAGAAVTLSCGGVTVITRAFCAATPLTVVYTVSVPERVNGLRQVRVPGSEAVKSKY